MPENTIEERGLNEGDEGGLYRFQGKSINGLDNSEESTEENS